MRINGNEIEFGISDMDFASRFGIDEAVNMVLDFKAHNDLPFIYDAKQLAEFFETDLKTLYRAVRGADDAYHTVRIPKKSGGERVLSVPDESLKAMQSRILSEILYHLPASRYATAYFPGAQLKNNAAPHAGKRYLLKLDVLDFFGSVTFFQVYKRVFNTRRFPRNIGAMLTKLCCRDDVLPQGAPTSPALSNLVMKDFDGALGAWCEKRGIAYTRYCDDMTFSSDSPIYYVAKKAAGMLYDMGLELNAAKTRYVTSASRQTVTGLNVNATPCVPRAFKRELRKQVFFALKYGADGQPDRARYLRSLIGKTSFVLQNEPENEWFRNALKQLSAAYKEIE